MEQKADDEFEHMEAQLTRLWGQYQTVFMLENGSSREPSLRRIDTEIEAVSLAMVAAQNKQQDAIIDSNRPGHDA
jgi:hypothetical protein